MALSTATRGNLSIFVKPCRLALDEAIGPSDRKTHTAKLGGCDQSASARQRALDSSASWSSWTATPEGGTHTGTRPIRAAVCRCESDRVKIKGQRTGSRSNVESAGTATLHRQHLQGARAEPAEEVRHLTRTHGEPLRPLWLGARAAGPLVALLTASRALVWQENEPQLRPRAAARQGLVRRPAASRPSAGSRRCRGSSWSSLQASWSRGRRDLIMTFQTTPPRPPRPTC